MPMHIYLTEQMNERVNQMQKKINQSDKEVGKNTFVIYYAKANMKNSTWTQVITYERNGKGKTAFVKVSATTKV